METDLRKILLYIFIEIIVFFSFVITNIRVSFFKVQFMLGKETTDVGLYTLLPLHIKTEIVEVRVWNWNLLCAPDTLTFYN